MTILNESNEMVFYELSNQSGGLPPHLTTQLQVESEEENLNLNSGGRLIGNYNVHDNTRVIIQANGFVVVAN